jgi:integrase
MNAVGREIAAGDLHHRARWRDQSGVAQAIRCRVDYRHEDARPFYCTTGDPGRLAPGKSGCVLEDSAEPRARRRRQWHESRFMELRLPYPENTGMVLNISHLESQQFAHPNPRRVKQYDGGQLIELPKRRKIARKTENGKVTPPRRKSNRDSRSREYLTPAEIESLLDAAASGRYGHRDRTLLLVMYRHGLRVSEAISLRWEQFDLKAGLLSVQRLKQGVPSTHPLRGPELRALRQLRRDWPNSPYLFVSERGGPMTASNVRKLVTRAGLAAKLPFRPPPPHAAPRLRLQARQ